MRPFRLSHPARKTAAFQQVRHFHPTRPTPFINEALELSSAFLHNVHAISGLPWAVSIPLSALIVRTTVALPLQLYSKMQAKRERDAIPLLHAWNRCFKENLQKSEDYTREDRLLLAKMDPTRAQKQQLMKQYLERKRIVHRRLGVPRFWKPLNFLQLPIWISIMESLRAMSGNDRGLVPWLLSRLEPESADPSSALHLAVEPSLANEGALWFPDLLAGDPTGILPLALTLSILLNIRMGWKAQPLKNLADLPKVEMYKQLSLRGIRMFVQVLALNVGLSSYVSEMPTALMIYWLTSTNVATLQTLLLDRVLFPVKPLPVWKRHYVMYKTPKSLAPPAKKS